MATRASPDFINKNVTVLSQVFEHVDRNIISIVLQQCQFDLTKASTILATLNVQNSNLQNIGRASDYGSDSNLCKHGESNTAYNNIIDSVKKGYKLLILIRGLPGSGKSTLATELLHNSLGIVNKNEFIFSADQYFSNSDIHIYNSQIDKACQFNQKRCFSSMRKGVSPIIIDEANLQMSDMKVYCIMAIEFGYIIEIAIPLTPWALKPKTLAVKTSHDVKRPEIKAMLENFQQNIAVKDLFQEFKLEYTEVLPQFRKYPPFPVISQEVNVASSNWNARGGVDQVESGLSDKAKFQSPKRFVNELENRNKAFQQEQVIDTDKSTVEDPNSVYCTTSLSTEEFFKTPDENNEVHNQNPQEGVNDFTRTFNSEDWEQVKKLSILFPNIPFRTLLVLYENCNRHYLRTADLISKSENPKRKDQWENPKQPEKNKHKIFDLNKPKVTFLDNADSLGDLNKDILREARQNQDLIKQGVLEQPLRGIKIKENSLETILEATPPREQILNDDSIANSQVCKADEELLLKLNREENKQIKSLRAIFPRIPIEDMLDVYEYCKRDIVWTADLISSCSIENIKKKSYLRRTEETTEFNRHTEQAASQSEKAEENVPRQQNVTERKPKPSDFMGFDDDSVYISDSNSGSDDDDEQTENLVELNLGNELVVQLENMFGKFVYGENIKPMVQMPKSLARQLHALYLESICRQTESQNEYISSQLKKDEKFAVELQEEEKRSISESNMNRSMNESLVANVYHKEEWKNTTPDTLALKLTQQKLHKIFPQIEPKLLDEILIAHDNNYSQTIEVIINTVGEPPISTSSNENPLEQPISDAILNEMRTHDRIVNRVNNEDDGIIKSAASYRDETNMHIKRRRELLQLAVEQQQKRNGEVAMFYRHLAYVELKKAEVSNQYANHGFAEENGEKLQNGDTLDLYFLYGKDAIVTLDIFIDCQISNLKRVSNSCGQYFVITGRDTKSEHGKSKLRPAVIRRLKTRKINFISVNPGMLQIEVRQYSPMSTDVEKR